MHLSNQKSSVSHLPNVHINFRFFFLPWTLEHIKCSYSGETKGMKLKSLNFISSRNTLLDKCLCNIVIDAITNYYTRALKKQIYLPLVLEVKSPIRVLKSRFCKAGFLLGFPGETPFPSIFQFLEHKHSLVHGPSSIFKVSSIFKSPSDFNDFAFSTFRRPC